MAIETVDGISAAMTGVSFIRLSIGEPDRKLLLRPCSRGGRGRPVSDCRLGALHGRGMFATVRTASCGPSNVSA
jgi:hypothetical protein